MYWIKEDASDDLFALVLNNQYVSGKKNSLIAFLFLGGSWAEAINCACQCLGIVVLGMCSLFKKGEV